MTTNEEFKTGDSVYDLDHIDYGIGFITQVHVFIHVRFKNRKDYHAIYGSNVYHIQKNNLIESSALDNISKIKEQLKSFKDDSR